MQSLNKIDSQYSTAKKILIIEDNEEVLENTQEILELADYQVVAASNGKAGVERAKEQIPDLILCDIMMPELDGYGVLRILSKLPETAGIPFIFLTAKAEMSDFRKGMNLGADDYITKPFDETDLLEAVENRLRKSALLKKQFEPTLDGLNALMNDARAIEKMQALSKDRRVKSFRKKETLYHEGDYAGYLYFIIEGKVKSVKCDDFGKEFITDIFDTGHFLGYMSLLEDGGYHESAIALQDTEVALIPKDDFLTLLHENRDVAIRFIKLLSGSVKEKEARLLHLAYTPVRERVAEALLNLHARRGSLSYIDISREDMAHIVGTAKESLIRVLSEFKKSGLVDLEGSRTIIIDEDALKKMTHS